MNLIKKLKILFFVGAFSIMIISSQTGLARLDPPSPPPPTPNYEYKWDFTYYWYDGSPGLDFYERIQFWDHSSTGNSDVVDFMGTVTIPASYSDWHSFSISFVVLNSDLIASSNWKMSTTYYIINPDGNGWFIYEYYPYIGYTSITFTFHEAQYWTADQGSYIYWHIRFEPSNGLDIPNAYYIPYHYIVLHSDSHSRYYHSNCPNAMMYAPAFYGR
jgi:hypothetical protein